MVLIPKVKVNEKLRIIERERSLLEDYLGIIQHHFSDFDEFVVEIGKYLQKEGE